MLGIIETVFTTLVDIYVMDRVFGHGLRWFNEQSFYKSVGSTQRRVEDFCRLDVEGGGSIRDLDVASLLFVPRLFEVAFLTQKLEVARLGRVAAFGDGLDVVDLHPFECPPLRISGS